VKEKRNRTPLNRPRKEEFRANRTGAHVEAASDSGKRERRGIALKPQRVKESEPKAKVKS
jgi:hypothetical protein